MPSGNAALADDAKPKKPDSKVKNQPKK